MNQKDKLKGNIAETESKITQLQARHDAMVKAEQTRQQQFSQQVEQNKIEFNQLVGRLNTLREMLPKDESGKNGEETVEPVKPRGKRECPILPSGR